MAEYRSKYPELGFYVGEKRYKFANGVFKTEDKEIQKVLDQLVDVQCIDAEEKPKAKGGKSSAK
ncbi:MAG: hypothetical protein IRZ03_14545 [Acidobacterium ailaaui]|nr:hypothetical protein [Pseudacidobacterium ailaaui]